MQQQQPICPYYCMYTYIAHALILSAPRPRPTAASLRQVACADGCVQREVVGQHGARNHRSEPRLRVRHCWLDNTSKATTKDMSHKVLTFCKYATFCEIWGIHCTCLLITRGTQQFGWRLFTGTFLRGIFHLPTPSDWKREQVCSCKPQSL